MFLAISTPFIFKELLSLTENSCPLEFEITRVDCIYKSASIANTFQKPLLSTQSVNTKQSSEQ